MKAEGRALASRPTDLRLFRPTCPAPDTGAVDLNAELRFAHFGGFVRKSRAPPPNMVFRLTPAAVPGKFKNPRWLRSSAARCGASALTQAAVASFVGRALLPVRSLAQPAG